MFIVHLHAHEIYAENYSESIFFWDAANRYCSEWKFSLFFVRLLGQSTKDLIAFAVFQMKKVK